MDATPTPHVLESRDVTKRFPGVLALDRMTLKVRPGTVHVLAGENGICKSTLMKILSGIRRSMGASSWSRARSSISRTRPPRSGAASR